MQHMEMKKIFPSRMERLTNGYQKTGTAYKKAKYPLGLRVLLYGLLLGFMAIGYYQIGNMLQYLDPTTAWLDTGTLSLALFAAWCCLLGIGIAGLLPAIIVMISKKGGIKKWKRSKDRLWSIIIFIGYIALLCSLL